MSDKIKVAICDDVVELCNYFQNYFLVMDDIEFVGMTHNSSDCLKLVTEKKPDILLLDIQLETHSAGTDIIPALKEVSPDTHIIMLTIHSEPPQIYTALSSGADDYIFKSAPFSDIYKKIRQVYNGEAMLNSDITDALLSYTQDLSTQNLSLLYCLDIITRLSNSEYDILCDLYNNLSYKDIAKKRFVEEITVRSQISRLAKKFNKTDINDLLSELSALGALEILKRFKQ